MAVIRSTSKPAALLVAVSMYSCGGYVVSLPTVKVPGVIKSLGGVTVGVLGLGVGTVPVLLVLPQAASNRARTRTTPTSSILTDLVVFAFWRYEFSQDNPL